MANGNTVASIDVTLGSVYEVDTSTNITADVYSNESTYSVGDYVIYAKFLYKCKTEISEPEDFDAEKWDKVKLANEVETLGAEVEGKADADSVYTKSEVDTALEDKADKSTTYTKSETDTLLNAKADASNVYSKTDVDTLLDAKADANDTYTKTEVDTVLQSKADANNVYSKSEVYTKSETDTALANKADSSSVYTKDEVYNKIQVDNIINNLPEPMIFKGTLGINGTITELPVASSSNEGFTYKVITDGTYASIVAKVGDVFVSDGSTWVLIPAGNEENDSWRNIKVNGVEKLGSAISSGAVDFADTANVKASFDPSGNKVQFTLDGVYTSSEVDTALSAKANSTDVYTKTETYSKTEVYNKTETYNKAEVDSKVGKPEFTKSFSPTPIATLTDGAENIPMKSLIVDIVPKQASGTPTPDNPLPISGSDEVIITHTGKNLADASLVYPEYPEVTEDGKTCRKVTCGSSKTVSPKFFKPNTQYTVKLSAKCVTNGTPTVDSRGFIFLYSDNSQSYINFGKVSADWTDYTATSTSGKTVVSVGTFTSDWRLNIFVDNSKFMLVEGTTATTYEPYNATTETITLPSTVYGGEVDVTTGKLRVTSGIVDLGSLNWNYDSSYNSFSSATSLSTAKKPTTQYVAFNGMCEKYLPNSSYNTEHSINDDTISISQNRYVRIYSTTAGSDPSTFKTSLSGVKLVYELATPIEIPLPTTPTTIKTQGGTESIYSDAGDVSGEYYTEQVDDIVDLIDDAKELPEVTSADEGKKLVVTSNGTWIANYDRYENKQICGYLNTVNASGIIYRTVATDLSFSKSGNDAKVSTAITGVNVSRIIGIHCVIKDTVSGSSPVYYIPVGSKTKNGSNTTMNISTTTTLIGVYVTVEGDGDNASGYSADIIIEYTLAST